MRFKRFIAIPSPGILLVMLAAVATLWLAATDQLKLYVHPRYISFSVIASIVGLLLCIWANQNVANEDTRWFKRPMLVVVVLAVLSLLVIKPATLSSSIATQRGLNNQVGTGTTPGETDLQTVQLFGNTDYSQLTVKDWSNLLTQTNDQAYFAGKQADVSGFIVADESDGQNVFFVSRFVVTCCAVDARPIGVPVYLPNWQNQYKADQWISVRGPFAANPSNQGNQRIILKPSETKAINQPKDPYVY
jgi:putative membrane protein